MSLLRAFAIGGFGADRNSKPFPTGSASSGAGVAQCSDHHGLMATILGSLVLGVSVLASMTHPVPYVSGTPTVISQIAKYVYGTNGLGGVGLRHAPDRDDLS